MVESSEGVLYVDHFATLQAAFDALEASTTKTKLVFPSYGSYTINADLICENMTGKVIEGNNARINVNHTGGGANFGIKFRTSTDSHLRNLRLHGISKTVQYGIDLDDCRSCTVSGCYTTGFNYGFSYQAGPLAISPDNSDNRFFNNTAFDNARGFNLDGEYAVLSNNVIRQNTTYGIKIQGGNNYILNNLIVYNDAGISVEGLLLNNSDHGLIMGNSINHNDKVGIYLKNLQYSMDVIGNEIWATVAENLGIGIQASSFGVFLENVTGANISNNTIARNKFGLGINGINFSKITDNTFLGDALVTTNHIKELAGTNQTYLIGDNILTSNLTGSEQLIFALGATFADEPIYLPVGGEYTNAVVGTAAAQKRILYPFRISKVMMDVNTAPTGSTMIVDVNISGLGSIFSTNLSIDANETSSLTAATPAVLSTFFIPSQSLLTVDIDQVGSTTPGTNPKVWLIGYKTLF